ncbi:uncharacterized protein [Triticum aestivum]|uniref:uncharacterized protein n=1 Tax=Triticum aestivum TaxID=4565 RepID=UPI001D0294CC|nr:uncharacterized protein LOC123172348 [Triticum aestivum]
MNLQAFLLTCTAGNVMHDKVFLLRDDETVQEVLIATQHRAASLDKQDVFVLAGEGSRGVQAVFVAAGEGSQNEQAVFVAASEGSQDRQAMFVAASEGRQEASEPVHALEATASSMIMEEAPLLAASEGTQDVHAVSVAATEGRQETTESGHALEATAKSVSVKRKYRKKNYHTDTPRRSPRLIQMGECCIGPVEEPAADHKRSHTLGPAEESAASTDPAETAVLTMTHVGSTSCFCSPTSTTLLSLTSTTPKAQTSEGGDAKSVSVNAKCHKNYHTDTPRRSPRLIQMGECFTSPVEEPTADHKRSRTLRPAEESAAFINSAETVVLALPHAGSTNCLRSPTSATFPSPISTSPKAVTSEDGDAKLVRAKAKHIERNYHILSLVREKPPLGLTSSSPKALSSQGGDAKLVTGKVKCRRKNYRPCKLTLVD